MAKRKYHTLEEAARFMSEPVERVRQRVEDKELSHVVIDDKVMIPALPLRDFYYDHLLKAKKSNPSPKPGHTANASGASNMQKVSLKASGEKSEFSSPRCGTQVRIRKVGEEIFMSVGQEQWPR